MTNESKAALITIGVFIFFVGLTVAVWYMAKWGYSAPLFILCLIFVFTGLYGSILHKLRGGK